MKKQYNYSFDPLRDYTKKEIAEFTGLSLNSVTQSLSLSGLSTKQQQYTGKELLDFFVPIRRRFDSGVTAEEIRAEFQLRDATESTNGFTPQSAPASSYAPYQGHNDDAEGFTDLDAELGSAIMESTYSIVDANVADVIEHLPGMVALSLARAARNGQIKEAFRRQLQAYYSGRKTTPLEHPPSLSPHQTLQGTQDVWAEVESDEGSDSSPPQPPTLSDP